MSDQFGLYVIFEEQADAEEAAQMLESWWAIKKESR